MAQLDQIGAQRLREMILADSGAGLTPQLLCARCRTYNIEEWLFPSETPDFDLMDAFRWRDHQLPWLRFFQNFSTCAFCHLVLLGLAHDPNFASLKFSADLAWVSFTLIRSGTVITTDMGLGPVQNHTQEGLRRMRHGNSSRRIVRHLSIQGVSSGIRATADWFPRSTTGMSQDQLLSWRPMALRGRAIDPRVPQLWLEMCKKFHGNKTCGPAPWTDIAQAGVMFIDVERRCIVAADSPVRYCALSYCWGDLISQRDFLKLTKDTKAVLTKENVLTDEHPLLPLTIRDAILFTKTIGCRYLWVDALCILQDSEEDMQAQINHMDEIYAHATLTIVAAAGKDAWAGLPGVRQDSRTVRQINRQISGITLSSRLPHKDRIWAISESGWYQRAWTLQEHFLSPRLLFFTQYEMFWECGDTVWEEGTHCESCLYPHTDIEGLRLTRPARDNTPFQRWAELMNLVSRRELGHEEDRLRCMQGLLNRLRPDFPGQFFWGMPVACLASALLFHHGVWHQAPFERRQGFPSWCWAGWLKTAVSSVVGAYDSGFSDDRGDDGRGVDGQPEPSWVRKEVAYFKIGEDGRRWHELPAAWLSGDGSAFYQQSRDKWMGEGQYLVRDEVREQLAQAQVPLSHALGFWTQSVRLTVDRDLKVKKGDKRGFGGSEDSYNGYVVRDDMGKSIGGISLTPEYRSTMSERLLFILIGQNRRWHHKLGPLLDLLHVETKGGITYRVQTIRDAAVRLETWQRLSPRWEFVLMA
ncbi:hypothetical protein AYL99_05494 [Fonsecaea erecta]|uniref:Heterokaryon incompatibility domain-containing protein n=1 Tax=Fonsecaea erecta TaxID=1367422 RepID=A0A178ZLG3_9EURO|nr:hypothetical protein AYL99_05494 [Fonsecaea erecta]OAP60492.1 hypothetical protein AYL99_05494 [Fonsecaea erecta]